MNLATEYLMSFLQDEFKDHPEVRIRVAPLLKPQRAADLAQDVNPEDLPPEGVTLTTSSRDYFFPTHWVKQKRFSEIRRLAEEIQSNLPGLRRP